MYMYICVYACSVTCPVKESYRAQNSLELKLPSGSSLPLYAKQRTLSPEEKKWTLRLICPAPSQSSLWLIFRIPCPSHLRDNYSEQPWKRTGPLKTVDFHIYAYIYLLFSWVSAAAAKSFQSWPTLCDPIDAAHQAPPSLGFSRQEHWSGLPFPSPMPESEK